MRTVKESKHARATHRLEGTEQGTCRHNEKMGKQGALTNWRAQREGQIRTAKKASIWSTHGLERAEGQIRTVKKEHGHKGHSLSGEQRGKLGQQKQASKHHSLPEEHREGDKSG